MSISITTRSDLPNRLGIPFYQEPIKVVRIELDYVSMGIELDYGNVWINSQNDRLPKLIDFLEETVGKFNFFSDNDLAYIVARGNGWDIRMSEEYKWVLDIDSSLALNENGEIKDFVFEISLKYS